MRQLPSVMALSIVVVGLALTTACDDGAGGGPVATQKLDEDSGVLSDNDGLAPTIEHEEFTTPQPASQYVSIIATITDDSDILLVSLYYKTQVSTYFLPIGMNYQSNDQYIGSIPSADLGSAGMHYYIEAVDIYGNIGLLPSGAPNDYFKFDLVD